MISIKLDELQDQCQLLFKKSKWRLKGEFTLKLKMEGMSRWRNSQVEAVSPVQCDENAPLPAKVLLERRKGIFMLSSLFMIEYVVYELRRPFSECMKYSGTFP